MRHLSNLKTTFIKHPNCVPLRAGIVGAGLMGKWHAAAIKRYGANLTAVGDCNMCAAQHLAANYHVSEVFTDAEQMLNRQKLDVLHICTPPFTHKSLADMAIDKGINLIIEKPITPTAPDTARLYDLATKRGVLVCPVHQFSFQEGVIKAKQMLSRINQIVHLEATFCSAGAMGLSDSQQDKVAAEVLPHPLYLMQMFLPAGLAESVWNASRPARGELRAFGDVSNNVSNKNDVSNISLSIFISMNIRPTICSFLIAGTNGTIHIDMFHGYTFIESGQVSKIRKMSQPFDVAARRFSAATQNLARRTLRRETAYPGLRRLIGSFYQAVQNKTESPISPEDTIAVARVQDALMLKLE